MTGCEEACNELKRGDHRRYTRRKSKKRPQEWMNRTFVWLGMQPRLWFDNRLQLLLIEFAHETVIAVPGHDFFVVSIVAQWWKNPRVFGRTHFRCVRSVALFNIALT